MSATLIKGWCPGALRPMESGDGLIVRIKTGASLATDLAQEISDWAARWGNGEIDLTARANLQIRGVTRAALPLLQAALAARGLLDADAAGEAVRNVLASPLAGLDATVPDIRPLTRALLTRLTADAALHALPGKFSFLIDDRGSPGLGGIDADVRFEAMPEGQGFVIGLGGAEDLRFGPCRAERLVETAANLALVFLSLGACEAPGARRMRGLVSVVGAKNLARAAGLERVEVAPAPGAAPASYLGVQPRFVGLGLPFGRVCAAGFALLAAAATRHGATELRLTPRRAVLVPVQKSASAHGLAAALAGRFILDPADARLRIAACAGAPACAQATTDVRHDALSLAGCLADVPGTEIVLHVSGCAKGCAHPRPTPATLVGRDGKYDFVREGRPDDPASRHGLDFGESLGAVRAALMGMT